MLRHPYRRVKQTPPPIEESTTRLICYRGRYNRLNPLQREVQQATPSIEESTTGSTINKGEYNRLHFFLIKESTAGCTKCWGAWGSTIGQKAKEAHHTSVAWRRKAWKEEALDDLPSKDEKVQAIVSQTNTEAVSKATLGDVYEKRTPRVWAFPSS